MLCRHCDSILELDLIDLGSAPLSNGYLTKEQLSQGEITYPLRVKVCESCYLVQTLDFVTSTDVFTSNYHYFSSTSTTWVSHALNFAEQITKDLELNSDSLVIEIASNDGYLLQHFNKLGIPNFGIEPTKSTAETAREKGVKTLEEFFSLELARNLTSQGDYADLIIGNNVYAHVPDINDFTRGMKEVLKPNGTIVLEFPHLLQMMKENLFDTIYHEHFSYLSLNVVTNIFKAAGLKVWDVEKISTHGGSLRVYGCHLNSEITETNRVNDLVNEEITAGLLNPKAYARFQDESIRIKNNLQKLLIAKYEEGKKIVAYGAAAKGNTLLNFAGVKKDLIAYVVDASIAKQGLYLPGSHIPVYSPTKLAERDFESILILPWNLSSEITKVIRQQYKIDTNIFTAVPTIKFY